MNIRKKSILVLTPRFPYPIIGGDKLRIYFLCKELSKHYSLTLLSLCETQEEMDYPLPDDGVFDNIRRVLQQKWISYLRTLLAFPTRTPLQVAYYRSGKFAAEIKQLLPSHDAVFAHLIRTGDYVRDSSKPRILEMTDAISLNYGRVKNSRGLGGLKGHIFRLESSRLKNYEKAIVDDFDLSVLVSNTDKNFLFGNQERGDVLVCSNGVELSGLPFSMRMSTSKIIAFIGNMRSMQNLDACYFFVDEILPLLRKFGDYKFRIVGAISDELARQFKAVEHVEVTGRVSSIANAVQDAAFGVCPMRLGAGVQNKVLEYMALGLPTITTTLGYEGIHAVAGRDLLIADNAEEFVKQIVWLDTHPERSIIMAKRARLFVESSHEWSAMLQPLISKISTLI